MASPLDLSPGALPLDPNKGTVPRPAPVIGSHTRGLLATWAFRFLFRCAYCSTETLLTVIPYSKQFVAIICSLKLKMHHNRFWPGLCCGPRHWRSLRRSPDPIIGKRGEPLPIPPCSTPLAPRQGGPSAHRPRSLKDIKTALCKSLPHFSHRVVLSNVLIVDKSRFALWYEIIKTTEVKTQLCNLLWLIIWAFYYRLFVSKIITGQNDTLAPVVPRVPGQFSRCPCGVGAYATVRIAEIFTSFYRAMLAQSAVMRQ